MTGHDLDQALSEARAIIASDTSVMLRLCYQGDDPNRVVFAETALDVLPTLVAEVERLRHEVIGWGAGAKSVRDERDALRAKLAAAEQERDHIFGEALRYKRLRIEEKSRADRAERALAAVREAVERFGRRYDEASGYENPTTARRALYTKLEVELDRILAAAEQDEPSEAAASAIADFVLADAELRGDEPKREQS